MCTALRTGCVRRAEQPLEAIRTVLDARYRPWLERSVDLLLAQNLLVRTQTGVALTAAALRDPQQAWSAWHSHREEWARHAGVQGMIELVERTVQSLPQVLRGELAATEVLFPDASVSGLAKVYHSAPGADRYHMVVAESVTHYLTQRQKGAVLRGSWRSAPAPAARAQRCWSECASPSWP